MTPGSQPTAVGAEGDVGEPARVSLHGPQVSAGLTVPNGDDSGIAPSGQEAAIGTYRQAQQTGAKFRKSRQLLAGLRVPHFDPSVETDRKESAVRGKCHAADLIFMPLEDFWTRTRGCVPQTDRAIRAGCGKPTSVWAERHAVKTMRMTKVRH